VGVSLLAIGQDQSISMLNIRPQSRAGSLPHWYGANSIDIGLSAKEYDKMIVGGF
jgi:hypothetical protein